MYIKDNFKEWQAAHVDYGQFEDLVFEKEEKIKEEELRWRKKAAHETPNGLLLLKNSFFKNIKEKGKIYLAHITPKLRDIIEKKNIQPSGGCLVGSIYCTHLLKEGNEFRMHNLGKYIFEEEALRLLQGSGIIPEALIIEVDLPSQNHNFLGLDYLRLGAIHFNIYKQLEYLLSSAERQKMEEISLLKIKKSWEYLALCQDIFYKNQNVNPDHVLTLFLKAIKNLPILGYFYFEVVAEYIMLFQDNIAAEEAREKGEFYAKSYKDIIPNLHPVFPKNFSLGRFCPTKKFLFEYMRSKKIFRTFCSDHFKKYIAERVVFLTIARLLANDQKTIIWNDLTKKIKNVSALPRSLMGHIIHRELRSFGRYPNFYFYFDQYKALEAWNYWNFNDIVVPFNGIIPKGELGINPAYADAKIKVFTCHHRKKGNDLYLYQDEEVKINIEPRLVNLQFAFMRNSEILKCYQGKNGKTRKS